MQSLWMTFIGAALVNNVVLAQLSGVDRACSEDRVDAAWRIGVLTTVVATPVAAAMWALQRALPDAMAMVAVRAIALISVVAVVSALVALLRGSSTRLAAAVGTDGWLVATNAAVLSAGLAATAPTGFAEALLAGFGTGVGFTLVCVLLAALRDRTTEAAVPAAFKGLPVTLLTAGLLALAFAGFAGLAVR
ncbi:Rnf-Nqr domain containing protein [Tahibacter amnicola]|uniref:Electron transport complex protein RnfA n=1 Tax=Tahibacter amnicola TaxID=2976241 RepID=A0ABY6BKH8_9GAMM|nr:Rnf-Nqr domain containing protein [Tahibacter amnicola]UXI69545.1 hypothetical protein N4264_07850 [Tahibacter amnicola]